MRMLIAEDDRDLNSVIARRLKAEGAQADACFDGQEALKLLAQVEYDVVILDIMMPRVDGLEVVRRMRTDGIASPVLFLTARDSVEDRVSGLDAGGDDYLTKPFALEELCARVRALSRRATEQKVNLYQIEDLVLDIKHHSATRGGRDLQLSAREYAILEYLIRNAGQVLTREQIERYIWNYDYVGNSNIVDVYIRNLRRKVDEGFDLKLIRTVRSLGYTLRDGK